MTFSQRLWVATSPLFVILVAVQSAMTPAELKTNEAGMNAFCILFYIGLSVWVAIASPGPKVKP